MSNLFFWALMLMWFPLTMQKLYGLDGITTFMVGVLVILVAGVHSIISYLTPKQ